MNVMYNGLVVDGKVDAVCNTLVVGWCRELHKEVVAGIDEAMARHAKETDKVDLLTLKQLKARVNTLEQQIVQDKACQLTVRFPVLQPLGPASCQQHADVWYATWQCRCWFLPLLLWIAFVTPGITLMTYLAVLAKHQASTVLAAHAEAFKQTQEHLHVIYQSNQDGQPTRKPCSSEMLVLL